MAGDPRGRRRREVAVLVADQKAPSRSTGQLRIRSRIIPGAGLRQSAGAAIRGDAPSGWYGQ